MSELGDFLKRLRRRSGLSQEKLGRCLGWRNNWPVLQIEQGRRSPDADTISRWVTAVGGTQVEEHTAQGLAGNIPLTVMPSLDQIKQVLNPFVSRWSTYEYPTYVCDYRMTLWVLNPVTQALTGNTKLVELLRMFADLFDVMFDSQLDVRTRHIGILRTEVEQMRRFKALNLYRQHEPFYRAYPECKRERWLPEDYARFVQAWNNTQAGDPYSVPGETGIIWSNQLDNGQVVYFQTMPEMIFTLNNCFVRSTHFPYDHPDYPENKANVENYLAAFRNTGAPCYTLWDVTDAQTLLDSYH